MRGGGSIQPILKSLSLSVCVSQYIELRKRFSLRSCQIWNTQKESQKFLARSMQTQLSACGNNEHGTFTEKEKQHTNICHFFKQTNGDLRQIFTDRNNCSILPSPNELKNVLSVCAFDSIKWNVYLTRLEKRLFPDCSEFASRCYRYVCDQLTTIEAVVDVFEFINLVGRETIKSSIVWQTGLLIRRY